ncbi:ADP-ribosyltransferase [Vibrio parahaemolyticus]|uniref:ADP-ribosyltransferase n=1 Tax=Vibrio parahaemolyticus TaxID=670 RepID=UPI0011221BF6|nr:ADP-ribosyltransferase [Vibrio parahaemolyticus]QLE36206.1 hypothetical protein FDV79_10760 [Vibrio parahaemolyticus]TOQ94256.1 hypothetical protein CGG84_23275 [Vibrio parahaemolyticus]
MLAELLGEEIYDRFWLSVQINHSKLNKNVLLDRDEAVAVYAYTNVYPPFYDAINGALREGDTGHFLIAILDQAIVKLPNYSSNIVYRWSSPPIEQIEALERGELVEELGYVSTLKEPNELDMVDSDCLLLSISHQDGRDISLYSDDFSSAIQEVLIPRGARFLQVALLNADFDMSLEQT